MPAFSIIHFAHSTDKRTYRLSNDGEQLARKSKNFAES